MPTSPAIPFAPELAGTLKTMRALHATPLPTKEFLQSQRAMLEPLSAPENVFTDPDIVHEEATTKGPDGNIIEITIVKKKVQAPGPRPGILYLHGGGWYLGTRLLLLGATFPWIKELDAVLITPEYRLAPENQHPALVGDCYAALEWVVENMSNLGIDPKRLMIAGRSSGAGLAAGTALLARDRKLPVKLFAQMLLSPTLDHRCTTVSIKQFDDAGLWTGARNAVVWDWVFGGKKEEVEGLIYGSPARATDLSGLPTTWIDCGSAEPFRDEDVAYASKLWECGVQTELHVWAGGFHGFEVFASDTQISQASIAARMSWMRRTFSC